MAVLIERVAAVLRSGWFMVGGLAAGALVGWRRAEDWPLLWASVGAVVGSLVVCLIGGIVLGLLGAIAEGRAAFRPKVGRRQARRT